MADEVVLEQQPLNIYTATVGQDDFDFQFRVDKEEWLNFTVDSVVMIDGIDYEIVTGGLEDPDGGTVHLFTPLDGGEVVSLSRNVVLSRDNRYSAGSDISSEALESDLDTIWMVLQDQRRDIDRRIGFPIDSVIDATVVGLPPPRTTW